MDSGQLFINYCVSRQIADVGISPRINLKLISREIIFEIFQHNVITVPERHGRTYITDGRTRYRPIVA